MSSETFFDFIFENATKKIKEQFKLPNRWHGVPLYDILDCPAIGHWRDLLDELQMLCETNVADLLNTLYNMSNLDKFKKFISLCKTLIACDMCPLEFYIWTYIYYLEDPTNTIQLCDTFGLDSMSTSIGIVIQIYLCDDVIYHTKCLHFLEKAIQDHDDLATNLFTHYEIKNFSLFVELFNFFSDKLGRPSDENFETYLLWSPDILTFNFFVEQGANTAVLLKEQIISCYNPHFVEYILFDSGIGIIDQLVKKNPVLLLKYFVNNYENTNQTVIDKYLSCIEIINPDTLREILERDEIKKYKSFNDEMCKLFEILHQMAYQKN